MPKLTDTGKRAPGSRGDVRTKEFEEFYKHLRSGSISAEIKKIGADPYAVMNYYKVKGLEYGRWVNFNDRVAYTQLINLSFYDLNKILGFENNIGFDKLLFAVGARGSSPANAHFEPATNAINITRFHRIKNGQFDKNIKLFNVEKTGGAGSIAHEYGHFLDYFFGGYIDQDKSSRSLSLGRSIAYMPQQVKGGAMRQQMDSLLNTIIWKELPATDKQGVFTSYYKKLKSLTIDQNTKEYWVRRTEIFARAFEIYIYEKLRAKKRLNKGLTHDSANYSNWPYIPRAERPAMIKEMDKLIKMFRAMVVDGEVIEFTRSKPKPEPTPTKKKAEPDLKPDVNLRGRYNIEDYNDPAQAQKYINSIYEGRMILNSLKGRESVNKRVGIKASILNIEDKLKKLLKVSEKQKAQDNLLEEAKKLPIKVKLSDLDYQLAYRAYLGTSFSPEKRAESEQRGYIEAMINFYDKLIKLVKTDADKSYFNNRMLEYKNFYLSQQKIILAAKGRTMSSMITGPAKFPTRRNQKALDSLENKENTYYKLEEKFEANTRKALTPKELQPIKSGKSDTVDLLEKKLSKLIENQEYMKGVNKIVKAKKLTQEQKEQKLLEFGVKSKDVKVLFEPDFAGRLGFPGYSLTNNNANIKRIKNRIIQEKRRISEAESKPTADQEFNGAKLVRNSKINRVQIFFEDKPGADLRAALKKLGFKWAPSKSAWQRYLSSFTGYTEQETIRILKVL